MAKRPDPRTRIIKQAMALAADRSWAEISLVEIAEATKLPYSRVYAEFPSKSAILTGFARMIDGEVMAEDPVEAEEGRARDRLFDVVMRRFDALQPYKAAVGNILNDQLRSPLAAACQAKQLARSMAVMLDLARIGSDGPRGALRVKGLTALYLATLWTWLRDDSTDMAKTMATLDGYLRRVESTLDRLPKRR